MKSILPSSNKSFVLARTSWQITLISFSSPSAHRWQREICRLIGSPRLKVLYDIYHMQINESCICDTITNYGDQFGHIHVADAPGRHEPGTGEINYKTQLMYLMAHYLH